MAGNNHIVNSIGRGGNAFSNTFHGLRKYIKTKFIKDNKME